MAPVIAVVAKVVTAVIAKVTLGAIAKFIVTTALSIGISKLIAKRAMSRASAGGDGGGRIQLPPSTDNKLPVVYGTAFIGGPITDAMLSSDQKTMWAVVALAEVTNTSAGSTISFGDIYYDGKLVQFGTNGAVTGLITNNASPGSAQLDTRVNGYLSIYLYNNGSSSPTNSIFTAQQVLSVLNGVPASKAWGVNQTMTNCAFAIIKVRYSTDAGTTGIGALTVQLQNTESGQTTGVFRPGSAIKDYMLNERYGCAIPLNRIDNASLTALNTYSDELIDYKPVGWNPGDPYSQQERYRINGPLDTAQNCLDNLQFLVDSCDSWLQYSELTGLWRVVINKRYTGYPTETGLFLVDSSNIIGGIDISPIDLNDTYNQVEVAYPNTNVKDQTDYQIINLFTDYPSVLSENEAVNRLNITLPLVNNAVQALYLAARRIFQSREDLVVSFKLDFSGIQLEAGDVIRIDYPAYGWDSAGGFANGKLFRVNTVAEEKDAEGNLFALVQAFEYNDTVYADDPVQDFIPNPNTGLLDPNVIDQPTAPIAAYNPVLTDGTQSFSLTSNVGANGLVLYMDFNYGDTSNVQDHRLYRTVQQSNGDPFLSNATTSIDINDLSYGNYYFSVTARNNTSGKRSNSSALFNWTGATIPNVVIVTSCNASSNGNIITSDPIANLSIGSNVIISNGTGVLAGGTYVTTITQTGSPTIFTVTPTPITPLSNACIDVTSGGFSGNTFRPNTINGNTLIANTVNGNVLIANTVNGNVLIPNTVPGNTLIDYSVTSNKLSNTGVAAGSYTNTNLTVGIDGRITAASNGTSNNNILVQDSGSNIVTTGTLNFTGAGVTVSNVSGVANINIPGGNGSTGPGTICAYWNQSYIFPHLGNNTWLTSLFGPVSANLMNYVGNPDIFYLEGGYLYDDSNIANTPYYKTYTFTSSDYYPAFQGTASTTNGFLASSGGTLYPRGAFTIAQTANKNYGWWGLGGGTIAGGSQVYDGVYAVYGSFQAVCSQSIDFQIGARVNYVYSNLATTTNRILYDGVTTVSLTANRPQTFEVNYLVSSGDGDADPTVQQDFKVNDVGMAVKHWTSGANLIITGFKGYAIYLGQQ
jgi:hypothetical protein